jgi:hypothetical protein
MKETCLNQSDLAARWKISSRTLERWRWIGEGPSYMKIGVRVIYRIEDVEEFERQVLRATSERHEANSAELKRSYSVSE